MLKQLESMWDGTPGEIKAVKHHIHLINNARAVLIRPYGRGPTARKETDSEVQRMRDQDVIEPA